MNYAKGMVKRMKDCLEFNIRAGKHMNIVELIDDVELAFNASLGATFKTYDTYDAILEESYNDLMVVFAKLELLQELGYIEKEEYNSMIEKAGQIRLEKLKELDGGIHV